MNRYLTGAGVLALALSIGLPTFAQTPALVARVVEAPPSAPHAYICPVSAKSHQACDLPDVNGRSRDVLAATNAVAEMRGHGCPRGAKADASCNLPVVAGGDMPLGLPDGARR